MDDFKIDIEPDIDARLHTLPELNAVPMDAANKVADIARGAAPHVTGAYAAGIVVQKTKTGARVFASDPKSAWVEFGIPSHGQAAQWVLRTAAEAAGLSFKKGGG